MNYASQNVDRYQEFVELPASIFLSQQLLTVAAVKFFRILNSGLTLLLKHRANGVEFV